MKQRSLVATLAAWLGGLSLGAVICGVLSANLGLLPPYDGFRLFLLGSVPGSLLSLVLGLLALLRTRASTGLAGRGRAWLGTGSGVLLLAMLGGALSDRANVPTIHDITTDLADPPTFSDEVANAKDRRNGVAYPDGGADVPELQRAGFPQLAPITVALDASEAFAVARQTAEQLGWTVTQADLAQGRIEAHETSLLFRFKDDVAIRIRAAGPGSTIVDLRSNSRVGRGDMGANAARIIAFRDALLARTGGGAGSS